MKKAKYLTTKQVVEVDPLDCVWNGRFCSVIEKPGQNIGGATDLPVKPVFTASLCV